MNNGDNNRVRIWEDGRHWFQKSDNGFNMGTKGEMQLPGQSWNQRRIKCESCSRMWLNLAVRPGGPDDSGDDPIIPLLPSVMTSLSLHPWCRIPASWPLTLRCADMASMCPRRGGDVQIKMWTLVNIAARWLAAWKQLVSNAGSFTLAPLTQTCL